MPTTCESVAFTPLPPAPDAAQYALHRAALEWALIEPIVIEGAHDIKSRGQWAAEFQPFAHQVQNLITFCRRLPVTLLADDVGLGKTISAGLILSELIARRRVERALVVCPSILGPQWVEELETKFSIPAKHIVGAELRRALERASGVSVLVTTYDSARTHIDRVRPGQFDMLILDEAHKMRNLHGSNQPPVVATKLRAALEQRLFRYVLMLTATPMQNRIWDLYSLVDLLTVAKGHANPLGTPEQFRAAYLTNADGRRLRPHASEGFRATLRQYLQRTRRGDAKLPFPARQVRTERVRLSAAESQLYSVVSAHISGLNKLAQTSLAQALMSSPAALAAQMANMAANGTLDQEVADEVHDLAHNLQTTAKLDGLLMLFRRLRAERPADWRAVVFTLRKETQDMIGGALQREGIATGFIRGGEPRQRQAAIEALRATPPGIHVIVSTDAGAEGVNLQAANVLVNFDLPWNPMIVEQRIGRVQRLASRHAHVVVINLVGAGTVEERVVGRLVEKLQGVSEAIGDVEAILESANMEGDAGEKDSFEATIRELVVKSLLGHDVDRAAAQVQASIEEAKVMMAEQRDEVDSVLGRLNDLEASGPRPPRIQPLQPSMPYEKFVIAALTAEGATVTPAAGDPDVMDVRTAGRPPERITFKEEALERHVNRGVFMGAAPKLYLPGRAHFERLVERWVGRAGHLMSDLSSLTPAAGEEVAKDWCEGFTGVCFAGQDLLGVTKSFHGRVLCRAKAVTGVDSLEKLVEVDVSPPGHRPVTHFGQGGNGHSMPVAVNGFRLIDDHLSPDTFCPGIESAAFERDRPGQRFGCVLRFL